MLNDIVSLDDGLILLLDEVDKLGKYGRSLEPKLQISVNPFQPTYSTPLRQKVIEKELFLSPITSMDVLTEDYDLDAEGEDEDFEKLKSLIIEGDDTKDFNRTVDEGEFTGDAEDEELELPATSTAKPKDIKAAATSVKAKNVLKQLSKATDLDYSNSRRLLPDGYGETFSKSAEKELEVVMDRHYICEKTQLLLLLGQKCHLPDCTERITVDSVEEVGCICEIRWICSIGHKGFWQSGIKFSNSILTRPSSQSCLHPEQIAPNIAHQQKTLPEVLEKFESQFMKIN